MKIESVDFFYLSMPEVLDVGDGSQDALLVRIRAGGHEGWGECEASPLTSIAGYVCPMSHSGCKPVSWALDGMSLTSVNDIYKINQRVHENCFDLLQADHILSGIDIALWDLLGKIKQEPVFALLGYSQSYPKLPYASQLFGDIPEETFQKASESKKQGYKAVKFGWGPIGKLDAKTDREHFQAARKGLGSDLFLMVDIGTYWGEDTGKAKQRLQFLKEANVYWLEEPFVNMSLEAYKNLSCATPHVSLAAGEGCNNYHQAVAMMDYAGLKFIQIDTGRVGGITAAKRIADRATVQNITYVNHTFTSHLALSASVQPFAGIKDSRVCEYPVEARALANEITKEKILPNESGELVLSNKPGLGLSIDTENLKKYLVETEIRVKGKLLYKTPDL
ncbi:mandelate racemase/muconate lactonizing enzyme family protein [Maribellus sp. YY47]|uniref:mandelate racemase/muconate lactonizing enzyme family protein n=1 Tax=Maribellus sp. YY47 TaxID=2929486 RepID=UPI002000D3B3|nr:mandelate racemase/muconate lactonizing enzyme family protein [Maribellus sp. YY47]MCK3685579.1 mandelate racemase/muconate lactonizing enzyme family protein [Maribellus sp. YY47]